MFKKKLISRAALILVIVFAAALSLTFMGGCVKLMPASRNKLNTVLKSEIEKGLDSFFTVQKTAEEFKVNADIDATVSIEAAQPAPFSEIGIFSVLLEKMKLGATVKYEGDTRLFKLSVNYSDNSLLDVYGDYKDETLSVASPQLSDERYDLKIRELVESYYDYMKDLWGYMEEPVEDYGDFFDIDAASTGLGSMLGLQSAGTEKLDETKTRKEVLDIYNILWELSTDKNTVITKNQETSLGGGLKTVKCDVYEISPSEEECFAVLDKLLDYLGGDSYLGEYIENNFGEALGLTAVMEENGWKEYKSRLEEYKTSEHEFSEPKLTVMMDGIDIVSLRCTDKDNGGLTFDRLTDDKDAVYYIKVVADGDELPITVRISPEKKLTVTSDSTIDGDKAHFDMELDLTKRSALGTFAGSVNFSVPDAKLEMTVSETENGMEHRIKFYPNEIGEDVAIKSVTVVLNCREGSAVEMPKDVTPVEVNDYEQFLGIIDDLSEQLTTIFYGAMLGGMNF